VTRGRAALVVVGLIALAVVLLPGRRAPVAPARTAASQPLPRAASNAPVAPDDTGMLPPPETAELIDDVIVSAAEVCPGEPFTVRVAAHDPDGADAGLYVVVAGARVGNPVVLSYGGSGDQEIPVTVFSKRGPGILDRRTASVFVRSDCALDAPRLEVTAQPAGGDALGFAATLRGRLDEPVTSYGWDFGDGVAVETAGPFVEHTFAATPATTVQGNRIVTVAAVTAKGRRIGGMTAVPFFDRYLKNKLEAGVLTPPIDVESMAVLGDDATLRARVDNREPFALALAEVEAQAIPCAGDGAPQTTTRGAASVLGSDVIPPGASRLVARLAVSSLPPGTCRVVLTARGSAPTGEPVELQVPLLLGEPPPTDAVDEDSADPARRQLFARIAGAQRLLGRDAVTPEEIDWLVRQGRLD
jgi:hypothetical protein